jgi:hypothetical protein
MSASIRQAALNEYLYNKKNRNTLGGTRGGGIAGRIFLHGSLRLSEDGLNTIINNEIFKKVEKDIIETGTNADLIALSLANGKTKIKFLTLISYIDKYLKQKGATARGIVDYKTYRIVGNTAYFDYARKQTQKSFTRQDKKIQPAQFKKGNIESSMVKMVRDGLKSFFKGIGQKDFVYEHGKTREPGFRTRGQTGAAPKRAVGKQQLPPGITRVETEDFKPDQQYGGAQGTNVEQNVMLTIIKILSDAKINVDPAFDVFMKYFTPVVDEMFDYNGELSSNATVDGIKKIYTHQGELTVKPTKTGVNYNPGVVDTEIGDYYQELLTNHDFFVANMVAKHGNKENFSKIFSDSPSMNEQLRRLTNKSLIENILGHTHRMNPDLRFTVNKRLLAEAKQIEGKKRSRSSVRGKKSGKFVNSTKKGASVKAVSRAGITRKGRQRASRENNPASLMSILNAVLPVRVAKNMTAPALRYRTGRFANSVRVTNVNVGPRGGTNLQYTYMRDPYETFEPGNKKGSTLRDPRRLIGGTIREIMAERSMMRFTMQRV